MKEIGSCPRCDSKDTRHVAESPKKWVWVVYGCNTCNFVWRSSETFERLRKLTPEIMKNAIRLVY